MKCKHCGKTIYKDMNGWWHRKSGYKICNHVNSTSIVRYAFYQFATPDNFKSYYEAI